MSQVRLRPKHQVTLPAKIVRQAKLDTDDRLAVSFLNGSIILTPAKASVPADLMSYAGIGHGLWGKNAAQVDAHLVAMKDAWQR